MSHLLPAHSVISVRKCLVSKRNILGAAADMFNHRATSYKLRFYDSSESGASYVLCWRGYNYATFCNFQSVCLRRP